MATTTNYSWTTPDDTDLVKDGAAAIRTLGSSADTTVKNLNPGTTAGDIDYYTSGTAKARIGIGTAGQLLAVNAGATAPEWIASPVSGKVLQVVTTTNATEEASSSTTFVDTNLTVNITPSSATSKVLIMVYTPTGKSSGNSQNGLMLRLRRDTTTIQATNIMLYNNVAQTNLGSYASSVLDSPATTSAIAYTLQFRNFNASAEVTVQQGGNDGSIIAIEIGA